MAATSDDPRAFLTDEVKEALRSPDFPMWDYSKEQCVYLLEHMYHDRGFVDEFHIDGDILETFLQTVRHNYNDMPFHNFHHCFCVTQMVYCVLVATENEPKFLTMLEKFAVMTAAVMHDLDHRGLNNPYQINSRSDLAVLYNDQSPLENHHCATGFQIINRATCNIFQHLSIAEYKQIRKIIIGCVLATDMAKHAVLRKGFDELVPNFDYDKDADRAYLCKFILMCSDISNEVRPWWVSRPWATNLLEEFFAQSDREKKEGLPVMPFMDRDKVVLESGQINFIANVLRPIWVILSKLLPQVNAFVDRIDVNYAHWSKFMEHKDGVFLVHIVAEEHDPPNMYKAGDMVVRKGEVSTNMYFIKSGSVNVVADDLTTVWDTMGPGSFFGEVGAFKGIPRTANIVASEDSEIVVVDKDDIEELLKNHPEQGQMVKAVGEQRFAVGQRREERVKEMEMELEHLVEFGG